MAVIHIVHRQPRWLYVMKFPAIGPITGPMNAVATKMSMPIPRLTAVGHTSVKAPPVTAIEEDPNVPLKKRQIMIV